MFETLEILETLEIFAVTLRSREFDFSQHTLSALVNFSMLRNLDERAKTRSSAKDRPTGFVTTELGLD